MHLVDRPTPVPRENEVLIRIHATTVSTADWRLRSLKTPKGFAFLLRLIMGFWGPRNGVLGTELSGTISAVGAKVTRFQQGDHVIAFPSVAMGCHAEYRVMPEKGVIIKRPAQLSHEQAASLCFGGTTALHFLRDKGQIKPGQRVLILGAAGCVGSAAVQLARHFGAQVTAVSRTENHELLRSLGAFHSIDYTQEDFTNSGEKYDLILDCVDATTFSHARKALTPTGRYLMIAAGLPSILASFSTYLTRQKAISSICPERVEDIQFLADLAAAGEFIPVIDSTFSLDQIVEAHRRVESGRKRGSVVLQLIKS